MQHKRRQRLHDVEENNFVVFQSIDLIKAFLYINEALNHEMDARFFKTFAEDCFLRCFPVLHSAAKRIAFFEMLILYHQ